jgi:ribosomal protein L20
VGITSKGLTLLDQLDKPVVELNKSLLSHMTQEDLRDLNQLLVKARKASE